MANEDDPDKATNERAGNTNTVAADKHTLSTARAGVHRGSDGPSSATILASAALGKLSMQHE